MVLGRMLQKHIHLPNPCAGNSHVTRLQAREHNKKGGGGMKELEVG